MMNDVTGVLPVLVVSRDKTESKKQMGNVISAKSGFDIPVTDYSGHKKAAPVFIEYTPEYKRLHGISNEIDLLRSPKADEFGGVGQPVMALRMPTPKETKEFIILLPVLLEAGNQGLNKLFDILDTWNNRKPKSGKDEVQQAQAMVLPDGLVEALSVNGINAVA